MFNIFFCILAICLSVYNEVDFVDSQVHFWCHNILLVHLLTAGSTNVVKDTSVLYYHSHLVIYNKLTFTFL